jgi:molybdate transport system substrate-binding protein
MKIGLSIAAARIALAFMLLQCLAADGAEIKLFSVPALRSVLNELGPEFERSTGHTLVIKFEFVPLAVRQIEAGDTFDLAILEPVAIDKMIGQGRIAAESRADVAYVGLGVGVRAGGSKPDIGSVDAFKRALLDAKSIAYQPDTGSGIFFTGLLERLGIAADVKDKLRPKAGGAAIPSVASGEAEMVVVSIPGILATTGVEFVGPLPPELQFHIHFAAGVSTAAKEPDAARALLKLLTSKAAIPVFKSKGLEPGTP